MLILHIIILIGVEVCEIEWKMTEMAKIAKMIIFRFSRIVVNLYFAMFYNKMWLIRPKMSWLSAHFISTKNIITHLNVHFRTNFSSFVKNPEIWKFEFIHNSDKTQKYTGFSPGGITTGDTSKYPRGRFSKKVTANELWGHKVGMFWPRLATSKTWIFWQAANLT